MNGKFEEKLARLAFGDLTPEEAERMEGKVQSNAKAAQALTEFRQIRAGLRDLAEVPEHQLSNERLRQAILARGLEPEPIKERRAGRDFGWLWMPVAAAILGVAIMNVKPRAAAHTAEIVMNPSLVKSSIPSAPPINITFKEEPRYAMNDTVKSAATEPHIGPRSASGVSRGGSRRHIDRFSPGTQDINVNWNPPEKFKLEDVAENATPNKDTLLTDNTNPPIMLIGSTPDTETGAPTATEVGSASHVVIGG